VYSAFGFAQQMPVFLPTHTTTLDQYLADQDDEIVFTTSDGEELLRI
jgi:hypothetical protein